MNIVVGEKIVNKPFPKPVDRDERNLQRVRKAPPSVDLAKQQQVKNLVNQKLVKKVNVEPPKISRVMKILMIELIYD